MTPQYMCRTCRGGGRGGRGRCRRYWPKRKMLVEASVWETFHQAKSALLEALYTPLTQRPHIPAATLQSCESNRASTIELISVLTEAEHGLKAVQDDFAAAQTFLSQMRIAAKNSLSPIGALPPELVRMVLSCASEVFDPLHTLHLSHVSRMWREIILSDQRLFTRAHWGRWNHSLVKLWCARAGSQPLTLKLNHRGTCEIAHQGQRPKQDILASCVQQLERLDIHIHLPSDLRRIVRACSLKPTPLLKYMSIGACGSVDLSQFTLKQDAMPTLHELNLGEKIGPMRLEQQRPELKVFTFNLHSGDAWSRWRKMLRHFPNLEDLCVRVHTDFWSLPLPGDTVITSPFLKHLKLTIVGSPYEGGITRLLSHLSTPELRTVKLIDPSAHLCHFICEELVSTITLRASGFI